MQFRRKLTVQLILLLSGAILLTAVLLCRAALRENQQGIRQMVGSIAATAALSLDGDLHQSIPTDPSATRLPAYRQMRRQLRQILAANPGVQYVWTMVKAEEPGHTRFILDVGGGKPSGPGTLYDASKIPDLLRGFGVASVDRTFVRDPWGVSISGYAPIRNRSGQVVALLGVDIYNQQLYLLQHRLQIFLGISLIAGILLSMIAGALLAGRVARPLSRFMHGMKQVEGGDLDHEISLQTGDEFEEAAAAFNLMTRGLREAKEELRESFLRAIRSLVMALEAKDAYTRGHSTSVTQYAADIARVLCKSPDEIETLERLAVLHDNGKIGVHDAMLGKAGPLTAEEWNAMRQHPVIGEKIMAPLGLSAEELAVVLSHHEREDGTGYPYGLARARISDLVAIVSVADAYDAMTSHRPYRKAMKPPEALAELRRASGTQFRPEVVEALSVALRKKGAA